MQPLPFQAIVVFRGDAHPSRPDRKRIACTRMIERCAMIDLPDSDWEHPSYDSGQCSVPSWRLQWCAQDPTQVARCAPTRGVGRIPVTRMGALGLPVQTHPSRAAADNPVQDWLAACLCWTLALGMVAVFIWIILATAWKN